MKILHYIDNIDNKFATSTKFIQMLQGMSIPEMENFIMSGKVSRQYFIEKLYQLKPDIVHIHSCWNHNAAQVETWTLSRSIPVLVSPHGQLMPNVINSNFAKQKLPRILLYQIRMIRRCTVLIADTSTEHQALKDLGWRRRISLIRNPYAVGDIKITPEETIETLFTLYQKVINTKERLQLSTIENELFDWLLYTSLTKQLASAQSKIPTERLRMLSALEWRHILIAAKDRGIYERIIDGATTLNLNIPEQEIEVPVRFKTPLKVKIRVNRKIDAKLKEAFPKSQDEEISIALRTHKLMLRLMKRKCESDKYRIWNEISELYSSLRFGDYNEETLIEMFKKLHCERFAGRMMQILRELLLLSEGFMPLKPINDNTTERIRKTIITEP